MWIDIDKSHENLQAIAWIGKYFMEKCWSQHHQQQIILNFYVIAKNIIDPDNTFSGSSKSFMG